MKKEKPSVKRKTHLTHDDRVRIQEMLRTHQSITSIAEVLHKSTSTISREIKNHRHVTRKARNDCINRFDCTNKGVCNKYHCSGRCASCRIPCQKYCTDYVKGFCEQLLNPPYVCNNCTKKVKCDYEIIEYSGGIADMRYRDTLVNRRNGFDLTNEQLTQIEELVSPLIKNGQSPYHIKQTLGNLLPCSEATLRRLIDEGELSARNIDLRNQVKRKPRKRSGRKMHNETAAAAKQGRKYEDYLRYIQENDICASQMDCVEGLKEDRAVLLTLHLPAFHFQLAFIMNEHTSAQVVSTLDVIEQSIGTALFREIFPVILTDNGHEFTDVEGMERSINGGQRTKIFFCEPNRSDEKGACENNHKYIRYVIPKGTSLEPYSQKDITTMMCHINSYARKSLMGKTPFEVAMFALPEDFFTLLGMEPIPGPDVILTPKLLSGKAV